ncbi:MAG: hypothetical protein HYX28_02360 [Candidatus Koribacter versatilis]|uniref:Uncharacterized protein n=1 Tax=Candidatus Korobacter versatilis TaxID=658062 RepID=A0A932A8N0_9BACT|nr:hypothetical protein [Candidatus Koribacter versatilis]
MPDPAQQLAELYAAGFEVQSFDRYPRAVGVLRDGAIALVEPTPEGLRMIGTAGWRMGEVMGVLVEKDGRPVFQAKQELLDATPERVAAVKRLKADIEALMGKG